VSNRLTAADLPSTRLVQPSAMGPAVMPRWPRHPAEHHRDDSWTLAWGSARSGPPAVSDVP